MTILAFLAVYVVVVVFWIWMGVMTLWLMVRMGGAPPKILQINNGLTWRENLPRYVIVITGPIGFLGMSFVQWFERFMERRF